MCLNEKKVIAPIGVRAIGAGELQQTPPPPKFWATQIFWASQQEKFGRSQFLQNFACLGFFFFERVIFYSELKSAL